MTLAKKTNMHPKKETIAFLKTVVPLALIAGCFYFTGKMLFFYIFLGLSVLCVLVWIAEMTVHTETLEGIPKKTTDELKELFTQPISKDIYAYEVAQELHKRGEDITFTIPYFIEYALSPHQLIQEKGIRALNDFFAETIQSRGINLAKVAEGDRNALLALKETTSPTTGSRLS